MVERNNGYETIESSVIPGFVSDLFVVNNEMYPKEAKWCGTIIKRSVMKVSPF